LHESLGILALMVLGHIGRRDEHNGKPDKLQLGDGTRSGTRHHNVGGTVGERHVGDERHSFHHSGVTLCDSLTLLIVEFSSLPQHKCTFILNLIERGGNAFIDGACAEASTHHKHKLAVDRHAKALSRLLLCRRDIKQIGSHGISG